MSSDYRGFKEYLIFIDEKGMMKHYEANDANKSEIDLIRDALPARK